jgi:hypothetical protein
MAWAKTYAPRHIWVLYRKCGLTSTSHVPLRKIVCDVNEGRIPLRVHAHLIKGRVPVRLVHFVVGTIVNNEDVLKIQYHRAGLAYGHISKGS